jgi:hypothetical protein
MRLSFHALLVVLAITVVSGVVFSRPQKNDNVLSETNEEENRETTPSPTASPTSTNAPTPSPTPKATVAATPNPSTITQNTPMLVFPGAKIIRQNSDETVLIVEANPNDVANWYRAELNKLGIKAIASSQNNINGNFQAKISASSGQVKYDIEIKRPAGENNVTIILR